MILKDIYHEVENLFKQNNESKINIDQGVTFLRNRTKNIIEPMTSTQKNDLDLSELNIMENNLQKLISNYALSSKKLSDLSEVFLTKEKDLGSMKKVNVYVNKRLAEPLFSDVFEKPKNLNTQVGKVGYIDDNGVISEYPKDMVSYGNQFKQISNQSGGGSTLKKITKSSVDNCKKECINNKQCNGFVFNKISESLGGQTCYLKQNMYPMDDLDLDLETDTYIRNININNNFSCINKIIGIDSSQFDKLPKSGKKMSKNTLCGLSKETQTYKESDNAEKKKIMALSKKIVDKMESLLESKIKMTDMQPEVTNNISKSIKTYKNILKNISESENLNKTIDGLYKNSDLELINKNFTYVIWTIVAIIFVTVLIRTIR